MKFVDEAVIEVHAGKGGDGCLSFRRERFIPFGGPDGGDGGDGGDIFIQAYSALNTLVDYRYTRHYKAENGRPGEGAQRTGRGGDALTLQVPVGTRVWDADTEELMGDLVRDGQRLLVAKGGVHGMGNTRFKTSTNRAPRHTTPGQDGENRALRLELQLLADVGLLGAPNAGKSSFIRQVSAARPKVADYPFTTLYPNLGVVKVDRLRSFVVSDIPGLIEGAAEGAGLGIRFLKHLERNRLLLHLVDAVPPNPDEDPVQTAHAIAEELALYSDDLADKERWLVLNKIDLLPADEREAWYEDFLERMEWDGPFYPVSALSGEGCQALCMAIMNHLEQGNADGYATR